MFSLTTVEKFYEWFNVVFFYFILALNEFVLPRNIRKLFAFFWHFGDANKRQASRSSFNIYKVLPCRNMKPPGSTKAAVYQWNNALGHVTDQLGICSLISRVSAVTSHFSFLFCPEEEPSSETLVRKISPYFLYSVVVTIIITYLAAIVLHCLRWLETNSYCTWLESSRRLSLRLGSKLGSGYLECMSKLPIFVF